MWQYIWSIIVVIMIDALLSVDNSIVVGRIASQLSGWRKLTLLIIGGGGAVVLRAILAFLAGWLLDLPYLGSVGGIALLFISLKLLWERAHEGGEKNAHHPNKLLRALGTVVLADLLFSLDNVLAVGAAAHSDVIVLGVGLMGSFVFLIVGSSIVSQVIKKLWYLLDIACVWIAWNAVEVALEDHSWRTTIETLPFHAALPTLGCILVLAFDIYLWRRGKKVAK